MKRITVSLALLCGFSSAAVLWQRRALSDLHASKLNVGFQASEAPFDSNQLQALEAEAAALKSETKELARLRNEVGQLRAKQSEVAFARAENERLLEARRSGAPVPREVPPGFISREQLRNAGYETPENALQTFLWAMREGDYDATMHSLAPDDGDRRRHEKLPPETRAQITNEFKRTMSERMVQQFNDFSVAHREEISEDTIVLYVRSSVSTNTFPHRLKRFGQEWKVDF